MAKGSRRYRRRTRSWGGYQQSNLYKVHATYGGLEQDVQALFFKLDDLTIKYILWDYEQKYGRGARDYAARTFTKWRSREVGMSGLILERLIHIVPPRLSFEQKYELLVKAATRQKDTIKVSLPITLSLEEAVQTLSNSVRDAIWNDLSPNLQARLSWLAQDDFQAAKALLREAIRHEAVIASGYLKENLANFSRIASQVSGNAHVDAEFNINLVGTNILVTLTTLVSAKPALVKER